MNKNVMHPRLLAFFDSTVMNALMQALLIAVVFLNTLTVISSSNFSDNPVNLTDILMGIVSLIVLAFTLGYCLWFWIRRPKRITVSPGLSNITGINTLYFILFTFFFRMSPTPSAAIWWSIPPVLFGLVSIIYAGISTPKNAELE